MAMTPATSADVFARDYLPAGGKDASRLSPLLQSIWAFYLAERPSGLAGLESDMLLFQSGIQERRSGPFFEVELVRQFVELVEDNRESYSQFHLTCRYAADERLAALGRDGRWCPDISQLEDFSNWVEGHPVLSAVDDLPRIRTEIGWEPV